MFEWDDFVTANNNILLNNFGNFTNRALKFVASQYGGVIPEGPDTPGPLSPNDETDAQFISDINTLLREYTDAMDMTKLRLGLQTVMAISQRGNVYLQSSGLSKSLMTENPQRCAQVVTRALNLIYTLSALIHPFMPDSSDSILKQLNAPARAVPLELSIDLLAGHTIGTPEHLFKRIDEGQAAEWRAKFGGGAAPAAEPDADATHVVPAMSKRKAAAAKKAAVKATQAAAADAPKTAEQLAWEQKIETQGNVVRELKARQPRTPEVDAEFSAALDELKKLKAQLAEMSTPSA